MKKYWILLILVVIAGISIPVVIIHDAQPYIPKQVVPVLVYLNTDSMTEVNVRDSVLWPAIKKVYLCGHKNAANDTIPWADAYLCISYNKSDSLAGDSLIIYLNPITPGELKDTIGVSQFLADITPCPRFKKCKLMLPPALAQSVKKYKYKYGKIVVVGED